MNSGNAENSPWVYGISKTHDNLNSTGKVIQTVTVAGHTVSETCEDEEIPKDFQPLCPYANPYAGTLDKIIIKTPTADELKKEAKADKLDEGKKPDLAWGHTDEPFGHTLKPNKVERVNHPQHYKEGGFEVIDVINAYAHVRNSFALGNAVKYILRAGKKDPATYVEDLKKAIWYLTEEVKFKEAEHKAKVGRLFAAHGYPPDGVK